MRNRFKLRYQLIDTETGETISIGDTVTIKTEKSSVTGVVESFPTGSIKLQKNNVIQIVSILEIAKLTRPVYVLMQSCDDGMFTQPRMVGITYNKDKAREWVSSDAADRSFTETKEKRW